MARTSSVPQRRTLAGTALLGKSGFLARTGHAVGREPQRSFILLLSALATLGGTAVLNFDSQSVATMMFVAGAGLAALILVPSASGSDSAPRSVEAYQARFAELQRPASGSTQFDRAQWAKLTAHMSHELRTPLNAVLGFSELMTKEVFGPLGSNCYGDYARDIHSSGRMLLKSAEDALAITAVLTSADRSATQRTSFLQTVVGEACSSADFDLASRSISIDCAIDAATAVCGDAQALRQAVVNLLAEAGRNASSGAVLRIRAVEASGGVTLTIALSARDAITPPPEDGFALILARTLCDLCGARLTSDATEGRDRIWKIEFLAATQNDLFRHLGA
ncbi:sensor histidine kinase [Hyphomicrobium methylovorum]|uniref:sensor histidine kinase n=1 Tax=Hyphomicrobium methylovorum TaxID=84 RepID=UPI0015E70EDB|nr:HAMP domain-containing sensor histidine kinase [Hyphomicrobium methylovorum]MBA2124667.1 sensor histidine kinase [Hyphomicrobium methylovorum]